jgi:peroxiredoxin
MGLARPSPSVAGNSPQAPMAHPAVSRVLLFIALLAVPVCSAQVPLTEIRLSDVHGQIVSPLKNASLATVFFFVRSDCPISNRYAPVISRLAKDFASRGIAFWLIYVDPEESNQAIIHHLDEYHLKIRALRDPKHSLVTLTGAKVTPEAVVILKSGQMAYRGRIDDRYVSLSASRPEPNSNDLQRVLDAVAAGQTIIPATTAAIGCFISDLSPAPPLRKP